MTQETGGRVVSNDWKSRKEPVYEGLQCHAKECGLPLRAMGSDMISCGL